MHVDDLTHGLLSGSPFYSGLTPEQAVRLQEDLISRQVPPGALVCSRGAPANYWIGVASGFLKIANTSATGRPTTLTHFSTGCWFGEGSLLKTGAWPYDAVAMVESQIALIPQHTFDWLLGVSFPFNRFLLGQLNARLGQFIERCEHFRLHDAEHHVAHCLAEMTDPRLYPKSRDEVTMSQEALAHLSGVSRSVVNRVLHHLERQGLLRVNYGSVTLLDAEGVRRYSDA